MLRLGVLQPGPGTPGHHSADEAGGTELENDLSATHTAGVLGGRASLVVDHHAAEVLMSMVVLA